MMTEQEATTIIRTLAAAGYTSGLCLTVRGGYAVNVVGHWVYLMTAKEAQRWLKQQQRRRP